MSLKTLKKSWFLLSLISLLIFAKLYPNIGSKGGILKPEYTVRYLAVILIFFLSGYSMDFKEFKNATYKIKIHAFIQSYTMVLVPLFVTLLIMVLRQFGIHEGILIGLITVSCMPPPVSSAVILTRTVGGNEAIAVFNSALGSFLGIFITPFLLVYFIGTSLELSIWKSISQLLMTIGMPLLIGQYVRNKKNISIIRRNTSFINNLILLLIIYTTFCDNFKLQSLITIHHIVLILFIVVILQAILLFVAFNLCCNLRGFIPQDIIAVLFCSTHKSLTLGVPMLKLLFENDDRLPYIICPLLIYHPIQIIIGTLLAPFLKEWIIKKEYTIIKFV